jgi:hypothetical protein
MEIKTRFKVGDIKWVDTNQGPKKMLINKIIIDINGVYYSSGDITAPEEALKNTKPIFQLPAEK